MPIFVSKTYEISDEASRENCDVKESGWRFQSEPHTFKELVKLMKEHPNPSSWPARGDSYEWYTSEADTDFVTGEETQTSIHYGRCNPDRMLKYWTKAARAAGILK